MRIGWQAIALLGVLTMLGGTCAHLWPVRAPSAAEINGRLGRGVNLGNALEAPREGEWGVVLQAEYFDLIEQVGFDAVRIPVFWSGHAAREAPYTIAPEFLARVEWAVQMALERDLLVVVNMQHYEELCADPDGERERFLALWEQIATRFRDYPPELLFELFNEPHDRLTPSKWNALLAETLAVVRQTNPSRTVVIGPSDWNSIAGLGRLELPEDEHLIVTVHYYEPFHFTHQGAEWVEGSSAWLGTTWEGTPSEQQAIVRDLEMAAAWAERHGVPLYVGEFGAYSRADLASRARWTAFVARQAEEHGFSWAYWEFRAGFGVYDPALSAWREPLLRALIP